MAAAKKPTGIAKRDADPEAEIQAVNAYRLETELLPDEPELVADYTKRYARKPWWRIELDYVTGDDERLGVVAAKWSIDAQFLRRHARANGWVGKRSRYRTGVLEDVLRECARRTAKLAVSRLERLVDDWGKTADAIAKRLKADAESPADSPPVFETISVRKVPDPQNARRLMRTVIKRRSPSYGSATQRAIVNGYRELLTKLAGLDRQAPKEAELGAAGAKPADVVNVRDGTPRDFVDAFRGAVRSMLGPAALTGPVPPGVTLPPATVPKP